MKNQHTFTLGDGKVRVETMISDEEFGMMQIKDDSLVVNIEFKDVEQILKISEWLKELYHKTKEINKN